jgi:Fis family transcriptional regulator, factor for inversion stimulation protein
MNAVTPLRVESTSIESAPALRECVARAVRRYLHDLDGHVEGKLHRLVLDEVERPLVEEVLRHCRGNQTRAAQMLGITRATLRKKVGEFGLD